MRYDILKNSVRSCLKSRYGCKMFCLPGCTWKEKQDTPYTITGITKKMESSILVFLRLMNTDTGRIITTRQIFLPIESKKENDH